MKCDEFERCSRENAFMTSFHNNVIFTSGEALEAVFGKPEEPSPDGKISMEWAFRDVERSVEPIKVFTLYDYKESSLYSSELPSPEELKKQKIEFHVGSKCSREGEAYFVQWVMNQLDS